MSLPPRLKEFDYTGQFRYFLTFCTHERKKYFTDADIVHQVTEQLLHSSCEHGMAVDVYCAMPDHVHALLRGLTDDSRLRPCMGQLKQRSGWRFQGQHAQRLWQKGYFDHVLRDEDAPDSVIAYIVDNPVRAGLVDSPEQYPFWGSGVWTREEVLEFISGVTIWKPHYKA